MAEDTPVKTRKRSTAKSASEPKPEAAPRAPRKRTARPAALPVPVMDAEERLRMIREAAYYKAERRGFKGGYEQQDWLEAEAEIDAKLKG